MGKTEDSGLDRVIELANDGDQIRAQSSLCLVYALFAKQFHLLDLNARTESIKERRSSMEAYNVMETSDSLFC